MFGMVSKSAQIPKVCIYARVSTLSQELIQQVEACKRFAEYKGLEVAEIYKDIGSGKDFNRPQFYKMLLDLRAMQYQGVVVFRIDRLGRSVLELSNLLSELERKGLRLYSVSETLDRTSAIGRLTINLIISMAAFERESIAEATKQRLAAIKEEYALKNAVKKPGEKLLKLGRPSGSKDAKKRKRAYFKRPNYRGGL